MVFVCSPTHRFSSRTSIGLEDVAGEPIVGFDSDLTIRREIDRVLYRHRSELNVVMEFDNIETIKRAVEIDAGVSLLPAPTIVREVETGSLVAVPISNGELVRPLGIIHRRGKDLGVTARRFIELLRTESQALPVDWRDRSSERDCEAVGATPSTATNGSAREEVAMSSEIWRRADRGLGRLNREQDTFRNSL